MFLLSIPRLSFRGGCEPCMPVRFHRAVQRLRRRFRWRASWFDLPARADYMPVSAVCTVHELRSENGFSDQTFQRRVPEASWSVKGREASLYALVALLILFEITNHPGCAAKERDLL